MLKWIAKKRLVKELKDPYPLPLGRTEFEAWSDKIIEAAQIPGASKESLKFALAEMVLHTKPNESFVPLGHFVHSLRRGAAAQVAHAMFKEIKEKHNAETKVLADTKV